MDWRHNPIVGALGVLLIFIALIVFLVSGPGTSADVKDNDTSRPVVMLCLACNGRSEIAQEDFAEKMTAVAAAECPLCHERQLWLPDQCQKCEGYFVPESRRSPAAFEPQPMPDGSMRTGKSTQDEKCPHCGAPRQPR